MKKILIVDDERDAAELMKMRLDNKGYTVLIAQSGEEALAKAKSAKPDLILLDIVMPKMDGYETAKKLKNNAATRKIDILFLTCKELDSRGLSERCQEVGARGYFDKLAYHQDLLETIEEILSESP
ncbi:MAG: response regulator [Candidatus Omnitrophota bacterium]